jgi:hypothetical protein
MVKKFQKIILSSDIERHLKIKKKSFIVFLDFDGVLHRFYPLSHLSDEENQHFAYKTIFENCIRDMLKDYDIQIVISSNWRKNRTIQELRAFFSKDIASLIIGKTPILGDREDECRYYLNFHKIYLPWIALDDYDPNFRTKERLVLCPDYFKEEQVKLFKQKVMDMFAVANQ